MDDESGKSLSWRLGSALVGLALLGVALSAALPLTSRTSSKLTALALFACPLAFPMPRPLTPLPHVLSLLPQSLFAPTSLPSLGVKGTLPLLDPPVELAGLSLLSANGFVGIVCMLPEPDVE